MKPGPPAAGLDLADGTAWRIEPTDPEASRLVAELGRCMGLGPPPDGAQRLAVRIRESIEGDSTPDDLQPGERAINAHLSVHATPDRNVTATLSPVAWDEAPGEWLRQLAALLCAPCEERGGVLVHGALAALDGRGVILAGPGNSGKTTASRRLPGPWRTLCDDSTLVVRGPDGRFWAHPWPTWSRLMFGGPGGTWAVEEAAPLTAIFFLAQADHDRAEPMATVQTIGMLAELSEQAWRGALRHLSADELRSARLRRFANICALAEVTPGHLLRLGRSGPFWLELERTLAEVAHRSGPKAALSRFNV